MEKLPHNPQNEPTLLAPRPWISSLQNCVTKKFLLRTSLGVQGLRLSALNAGGMGSVPGPGTKIPHAAQYVQKTNK